MKPERIVLTGGPSGGKSTALEYLALDKPHMLFESGPEVATMLLSGGFPAPDEWHTWSPEWQRHFQHAVAATQLALEPVMDMRARRDEMYGTVFDRGLADGAAYLGGGMAELCELVGLDEAAIMGRYGLVIHLVSSAKQPRGYQKHTNQHRFEETAEAAALDDRVQEVWQAHPNRHIIDIEDTRERNHQVLSSIHRYMQRTR